MHDRAGRSDRRGHVRAAEAVERFDLEMFAQGEGRLFRQKRVAVVFERVIDFAGLRFLFRADQQFRRRNARQFVEERLSILHLGQSKLPGGEIGVGETKRIAIGIDRAEIIRALRVEPAQFADRAGADDLRDVAIDNFAPGCGSLV